MSKSLAALAAVLILASCGAPANQGPAAVAVFIPGTLQGSPTYELLDKGVRRAVAEVPGTTVQTVEGGFNQAQWGEQIATLAAGGQYRYIVTSNPAMPEIAAKAAAAYPNQKFLILEAASTNPSYATLAYNHRELAYLHGVLGGLYAKEKKATVLGLIAGQEYPDMNNVILPGFEEGLKSVVPQGKVEFRVVGNWYDAAKGAELAKGLFEAGAAVILPIAGGANQGVVTAAKAAGKGVLWYDIDGYAVEPGTIWGSGALYQDKAAYEMVKNALAGKLKYGEPQTVGAKEGYIGYPTEGTAFGPGLSDASKKQFAETVKGLESGTLALPATLSAQ